MLKSLATATLVLAGSVCFANPVTTETLAAVGPDAAARGGHEGATVLWGGLIVGRTFENNQTCLQVAATALDSRTGRPDLVTTTGVRTPSYGQRFFACQEGTLGSADYARGRFATFAGTVGVSQERLVNASCASINAYRTTQHDMTQKGCEFHIPVIAVSDSRSWPSNPDQRMPMRIFPMPTDTRGGS